MVKKNFEDMFNRLHTIPACDGQTDGQTDILPRHSPRYAYASRSKMMTINPLECKGTATSNNINWHTGSWLVGFYIWYSEEGTGRGPLYQM